jgi:glycosyltransferase involved in cell wall biosynthesis
MNSLVSILIPAFNAEGTIAAAIQSAIAQTWPRIEIIVVDDGSCDRTAQVAERFGNKIRFVSRPNQGAAAARNEALALSSGDYIQWLDADDLLPPDKVERQLALAQGSDSKQILLSSTWAPFFYRTRNARFIENSLCHDLAPVEWLLRKLTDGSHMQTATWLTSRELAEAAGKWDTRLSSDDDGEYFCRVLLASEGTRFTPNTGVYYRITPTSRLSFIGGSNKKKDAMLLSLKLHIGYIRSLEESERVRKACVQHLQNWYLTFYPERTDIVAEMNRIAEELGGRLEEPQLRWKFAWMRPVFGWGIAKRAQLELPHIKATWQRKIDKTLYQREIGRSATASPMSLIVADHNTRPEAQTDSSSLSVSLLTGGGDRPYVFGLGTSLMTRVKQMDVIGSDDLVIDEFHNCPSVTFLNLRGSHRSDVGVFEKVWRVSAYYVKLMAYAAAAKPKIFHILWNNKFATFDRTLLMLYYRLLGKKIVLTVHNVNAGKRDHNDSWLNRLTLCIQYRLAQRMFVHTERMKKELMNDFGALGSHVIVIPFGINNALPTTDLNSSGAKARLGFSPDQKVVLFFGSINPYKGLELLIDAFRKINETDNGYRLVIAGKPDRFPEYWSEVLSSIQGDLNAGSIFLKDTFIPDVDVELYFKAADVLVLPYRDIYQSGVLFLGQSFGLPIIATDVGSLKDEIVEGETGYVVRPGDYEDLARALKDYFGSDIYADLESRRQEIRDCAIGRHSWDAVGKITIDAYSDLLKIPNHEAGFVSTRAMKNTEYEECTTGQSRK